MTAVAPVRSVPVRVTGTVLPRTPVAGLIDVSDGLNTVNAPAAVAVPPGVLMVTLCPPREAVAERVNVAVMVEALVMTTLVTVTPELDTVTESTPEKFEPEMVTLTEVPR